MIFFYLLSKLQHSPFELLDMMIMSCNFSGYIDTFLDKYNENQAWEMWIHKDTGKSWGDFKLLVLEQEEISREDIEKSNELYNRLCERGG